MPQAIPHVERSGKVCIAPEGGVLIDVSRLGDVVEEALIKARGIIAAGMASGEAELQKEFLAYWDADAGDKYFRVVTPLPLKEGPIAMLHALRSAQHPYEHLIAATAEEAKNWASRAGFAVRIIDAAYILPLEKSLIPPRFGEKWTVKQFFDRLAGTGIDTDGVLTWLLDQPKATCDIIITMPGPSARIAVGVRLQPSPGPAKPNTGHYYEEHPDAPARRFELTRLDTDFLIPRAGGLLSLATKTVVLVGCGAVGSQAAKMLALLGVGKLHLIDPELLGSENVHRHLLGVEYIHQFKASSLAAVLGHGFPHSIFKAHDKGALEVLSADPDCFLSADAILMATGDETLELRFDSLLKEDPPRVHTWVDPLGLGGHAIAVGLGDAGCLHCLYETADSGMLANTSSFVRPGQLLRKSFAGCGGDFLPYSALDAIRTATEASALLSGALLGQEKACALVSWHGDSAAALQEGVKLSEKVALFAPGERKRYNDVRRLDCPNCGRK